METGTIVSILIYFSLMLAIGIYGLRHSTDSISGFLLGGRKLGPAVTALSAGASDMSAWILMGLPGAMYVSGLSSAWIALGLVAGAWLNYLLVAPRLRIFTALAEDAITLPDYFEKRFEDKSHLLRIISSLVIVVFFTLYTSSGMVAGGLLFESSLGMTYETGLWVSGGVVVAYTFLGGFHAVCLTDFVQGCIILIALVLVPVVVIFDLGGPAQIVAVMEAADPVLLNAVGGIGVAGILSNLAWGLGYFGQPHIIVRFMAIRSVKEMPAARRIGISWMTVSLLGALATGACGLAYVRNKGLALSDPETVFILLSQVLFHPLIGGFLLAAILAAVMSTISSQLLVSSSSLTEDFYKLLKTGQVSQKELVLVGRLSVVLVALLALYLAYERDSSILTLVSHAWAGFGAAFGPLILFSLFWPAMTGKGAIAGVLVGALTVLLWVYGPFSIDGRPLTDYVYEIVPGFILSSLAIILLSRFSARRHHGAMALFEQMLRSLESAAKR